MMVSKAASNKKEENDKKEYVRKSGKRLTFLVQFLWENKGE